MPEITAHLVEFVLAFIAGLLGGLWAEGARKMFAPLVIPKKLHLGRISKSKPNEERQYPYWYIPVSVKANICWNLVASSIDRVRGGIEFVNRSTGTKISYSPNEGDFSDVSLAHLGIGDEYKLKIASMFGGTLRAVDSVDQEDTLVGDYDINVELLRGQKSLGKWSYPKAILNGLVQEIEPDKGAC